MTATYAANANAAAAAPKWRAMTRRACPARGTAVAVLAAARPEGALAAAREAAAVGARKARNRKRARSRARNREQWRRLLSNTWEGPDGYDSEPDCTTPSPEWLKGEEDRIRDHELRSARYREHLYKVHKLERELDRCLGDWKLELTKGFLRYTYAKAAACLDEHTEWLAQKWVRLLDVGYLLWEELGERAVDHACWKVDLEERRARGRWDRLRQHVRHRAIALHWQGCTQRALCAPGGRGRIEDRAAFVSEWRAGEVVVVIDQRAAARAAERVQLAHYGAALRRRRAGRRARPGLF